MVSFIDSLIGLITLSILGVGYYTSLQMFSKYLDKKTTIVLITAILFISLPSPWIGPSWIFISSLFSLSQPNNHFYAFSIAWAPALTFIIWINLTFNLLSITKKERVILSSSFILSVGFLYFVYFEKNFIVNQSQETIFRDLRFISYAGVFFSIMALILFFIVPPIYFWVSIASNKELIRFRTMLIALGSFLYLLGGFFDGFFAINQYLSLFVRIILLLSLFLLNLGYNTPKRIREAFVDHSDLSDDDVKKYIDEALLLHSSKSLD